MRSEKLHLVNYIGSLLKDSDYVYFISYSGLKVADMTVLRNKLAEAGAGVHVLKNTLKHELTMALIKAIPKLLVSKGKK